MPRTLGTYQSSPNFHPGLRWYAATGLLVARNAMPFVHVVGWKEIKIETTVSKKADARTTKAGRSSLVDAAIQVMHEIRKPMGVKAVVNAVLAKRLWSSDGKTPTATLSAAILREIRTKGAEARFRKTDRGMFELKA